MRKNLVVVAALSVVAVSTAQAQNGANQCSGQPAQAQDACNQIYDAYQFLAPQLALAVAGGNATLGTGSTLGGPGHFSIGVRANAVQGAYPEINKYTSNKTGPQRSNLSTKDQLLPFPTADAALGIFGGIPLGVTNVLAIDALGSASYIPTITQDEFTITPSQNWQIGYGARVGILQESILVPGVSITYLKRDLPTTTISAKSSDNNALTISNLKVETTSIRLVASKSFTILGLAAGVGQDQYDQSANITAVVTGIPVVGTSTATVANAQSRTRTNIFGDVSLNLPFFKIIGEVGQVSGGDAIETFNSFSSRADRSLMYFSAGIRLAW